MRNAPAAILLFFIFLTLVFSLPAVRNFLAHKSIDYLNHRYDVQISLDKIYISPFGKILADHVLILDHHNDTLIFTEELQTRLSWKGILDNRFEFRFLSLKNPYLRLVTYQGEAEDNLNVFIKKLEGEPSSSSSSFFMKIENIAWNKGQFVIYNHNIKKEPVYEVKNLNSFIPYLEINGKNFLADIDKMNFTDKYGILVRELQTRFTYTPDSMRLEKLSIRTDSTFLLGELRFYYTRENLKHFFDEVELQGDIKGHISSFDMNKLSGNIFAPGMQMKINSRLEGVINELELNDAQLEVPGTALLYQGDLIFYELTDLKKFAFRADAKKFRTDYHSLEKWLPEITRKNIPRFFKRTGLNISKGNFSMNNQLIEGQLEIENELGKIHSDFTIKQYKNIPVYKAFIQTNGFEIGKLLKIKKWGTFAGKIQLDGKGKDLDNLNGKFQIGNATVEYQNYSYQNLAVSGKVKNKTLNWILNIKDKNLTANANGNAKLGKRNNFQKFKLHVKNWDLFKTHWIKDDTLAVIKFEAKTDLSENSSNDFLGTLEISDLEYRRSEKTYIMRFFKIRSEIIEGERFINIQSDKAVNGYLKGNFNPVRLPSLIKQGISTAISGKNPENPIQDDVRFNLNFNSDLLEILNPSVHSTRNTLLKGYISGKENYVHADLKTRLLIYEGVSFYNTNLIINNQNPIYNFYIKSDSISTGFYTFSSIQAINISLGEHIHLKLKGKGGKNFSDEFNLSAKYKVDTLNNFHLAFADSYMIINNKKWTIPPEKAGYNLEYFQSNDSLQLRNIQIRHQNEKMNLFGYNSPRQRNINLNVENLNINEILPELSGFSFKGILNAQIFSGKNNNNKVFYNADAQIQNLQWNETPLGNFSGKIKTLHNQVIFMESKSALADRTILSAFGFLDWQKKDLDINLNLNQFPLNPFNELLQDVFSNIRGKVNGSIFISGNLNNPQYNGSLQLFGAGLKINELNTDYQFADSETVKLEGDRFIFDKTRFFDTAYNTQGNLSGFVSFYNFSNWFIDLLIQTNKLLVLNTVGNEESLYYGTAFASGHATIKGHVDKLKIDASVKSEEGTRIFIPLKDVETLGEDDFIRFYSTEEYRKKINNRKNRYKIYEGLQLNFDIDITQNAEIEIVLDQEFGSKLKSRGEGTVLMEINTEGKFNMWGAYQVVTGKYNFRYAGVIDKEFDVEPGSTLIWNGDPFRADLDITASYFIQAADITPLLTETSTFSRRIPVKVIINIKGDLMKPRIDFEVKLPDANPVIRSEVEYVLRDPDMRMLQVISLLYSGNFIAPDILKFDNRTALEGNLSERVLNVFNSLLENDIFNLKLDYVPDRQDPNTNIKTDSRVGLVIQTKINKRLYINGKLAVPVGRYTKSSVSGDVEVDIWLNENGTVQLRIYNKKTDMDYLDREEYYMRGLGINFQVDFDTFKELLKKLKIDMQVK